MLDFTIQNVPIKLRLLKLEAIGIILFTIQNVPIKFGVTNESIANLFFTIQNVPIKYKLS